MCLAVIVLLAGCGGRVPVHERSGNGQELAGPVELDATPFFPQEAYQCGPAALATGLAASGVAVTPSELEPLVYLPARRGSLQAELTAASRRFDRIPYRIAPTLAAVLDQLSAGRPVLVLQNLGFEAYPVWHYAVVVGFDGERSELILRSGTRRRQTLGVKRFLRTWEDGGFWGIVVLRPGELPAGPDRAVYLEAVAALEAAGHTASARRGYEAALGRWPDDPTALLGLSNALYADGVLDEAEAALRRLLEVAPNHAIATNNLAVVLADKGCREDALRILHARLAGEGLNDALRRTLETTAGELAARPAQSAGNGPASCGESAPPLPGERPN